MLGKIRKIAKNHLISSLCILINDFTQKKYNWHVFHTAIDIEQNETHLHRLLQYYFTSRGDWCILSNIDPHGQSWLDVLYGRLALFLSTKPYFISAST